MSTEPAATNSNKVLFNSALSPHQAQLNQLLGQSIQALEAIANDVQSSPLELALELAPVLAAGQSVLNGTDLTLTLASLRATHDALLSHDETYLQDPIFSEVQDFLVNDVMPLQAQFPEVDLPLPEAPLPEQTNIAEATSEGEEQTNSSSRSDDGLGFSPEISSAQVLDAPAVSLPELTQELTLANLEATVLAMKGDLERIKDLPEIPSKDLQTIDSALISLDSQLHLLGSMTAFDADSPLVIGNAYAQFEQTSQSLRRNLSDNVLEQMGALPVAAASDDSPLERSQVTQARAQEDSNEVLSSNPVDSMAVLEAHQVPQGVRNLFLVTKGGQYHYKDRDHALAFMDAGGKLKTANADPQVASAMVAVAKAKGWGSLKIAGSPEFKSAIWLAAQLADLPTEGYRPTELDRALLAKTLSDLQSNSITQGENPKRAMTGESEGGHPQSVSAALVGRAANNAIPEAIDPKQARAMAASDAGFTGKLIEFGKAPYQFSTAKGEPMSYFVRLADATGKEHLFWGKELEAAIHATMNLAGDSPVIGRSATLYQRGKKAVETTKSIRDANGEVIGQEPISAMRNAWDIALSPEPALATPVFPVAQKPSITGDAQSHTAPQSRTAPPNTFELMAKEFSAGGAHGTDGASKAIAKYPQLVPIYASQKSLFEQAALTFTDPADLANAQASINTVLTQRISQGKLIGPQVSAPRYSVTIDSIFERNAQYPKELGNLSGNELPTSKSEQVLRFIDAKNTLHELAGVDLSLLSAQQLIPGAPLTLTQVQDSSESNKITWQATMRDPAIDLHGVASAEWVRSMGANEAQAKTLAGKVMSILETHSQSVDPALQSQPLSPPKLQTGSGFALPMESMAPAGADIAKQNLARKDKRVIAPVRSK